MANKPKIPKRLALGESDGGKKGRIDVQTEWAVGPRTSAWDALWRRILADISDGNVAVGPENDE